MTLAMKILVCIKQVPGSSNVEVDPVTGVLKRSGVASKINPYDLYALETAFCIAEKYNGEVECLTMGPPQAKAIITEAVCMGAKGGTVISDRKFAGADVLATSYTLSQGIKKMGDYDIIICGKQTTDGDTAQVGAELSEFLNIANVSNVLSVDSIKDGYIDVTAALDSDILKLNIKLPCLISMDADINTPRLPSYKVKKAVGDDTTVFLSFDDLEDKNPDKYGLSGSATQVERIFPPEKNTQKENFEGSAESQSQQIFELLFNKKLI